MRTNIDIDDKLMADALKAVGLKTKHDVVDYALKMVVRLDRQKQIRQLRGKMDWQGDLEAIRLGTMEPTN